jgi:hypothetical protein
MLTLPTRLRTAAYHRHHRKSSGGADGEACLPVPALRAFRASRRVDYAGSARLGTKRRTSISFARWRMV